ncbi:penicillin acylase family protein [Agromyces sp. NPDC058110]|uniref:penicillin acylase family protein n=1 Tax=Agromyces sp. NPDC058110 TaxID=3346345 RepID=UPI0036DA79FA
MITRDELGIPYLRGGDVFELAAAQGEATAHDRGWQIEVDRRRAEGTLAALIGPAGLDWDVFARRARLDDTARRAFAALGDEDRAFVVAYVEGVRRGMRAGVAGTAGTAGTGASAAEFAELDALFGRPAPLDDWPEHAPLGVLHVAHALFSSFPSLLWAEHVGRTLGGDWVDALSYADDVDPSSGSNAWAVHGSLTSSGLPVLAGDPHRLFELPGVYQQVGLACDEFDVIGLAFPGVPGIAHFGHTGHAAWGITNAMAHSVDVFHERLRRVGGGHGEHARIEALGPDGWRAASVEHSLIEVRGGDPVWVEAIETERGTVVTDLAPLPGARLGGFAEFEAWSVRMPARTGHDLGFAALLPLLRARSAADVVAAFGRWVDPVNRLLAADRQGEVLSATVGRAPDRPHAERRLPLDGRVARPAEDRRMPRAVAVDTIAVDANERPARDDVDLGRAYAAPHRARRIRELLETRRPASTDEFEPIWGDALLGGLGDWLALLPSGVGLDGAEPDGETGGETAAVPAVPAARTADLPAELPADLRRARDELLAWDGVMGADSPAAARFAAFREALVERVAALPEFERLHEPHPFGAIFDPWMGVRGRIAAALPALLLAPALADRRDALVRDALAAAAARPIERWGDDHRLLPLHVFVDVPGVADPGRSLDAPLSGDGESVRCTGSTPGITRRSWRGSVARWAWDLADRDRSRWSVPFGASGDPASPHFADQLAAWVGASPPRVAAQVAVPVAADHERPPTTSAPDRTEPA